MGFDSTVNMMDIQQEWYNIHSTLRKVRLHHVFDLNLMKVF